MRHTGEPMKTNPQPQSVPKVSEKIRVAATDKKMKKHRRNLALASAKIFSEVGNELQLLGHVFGPDRRLRDSPFGHGSDETVAVSVLLRIGSQLISASTDLFTDGRNYSAAALLRQVVEVEYLAWAIETRDRDGERWLRSDRQERESFFAPRKLRQAAQGKFRGKDYGYHCELGGHPVPTAGVLLENDPAVVELLLSDLLGHVGGIWDHLVGWARRSSGGAPILNRSLEMSRRFSQWKALDPLVELPPPP